MSTPARFEMYEAIRRSGATPLRSAAAGADGAWIVHWHSADTETFYHQPDNHTLSLYLRGGESVRCRDVPAASATSGRLCCMPAGHQSRWDVRGSLELLHLYLPRLSLALAAERWFDIDPRHAALEDRIYFDDPVLTALGTRLATLDWQHIDAPLRIQHLVMEKQARLLLAHCTVRTNAGALAPRGGLGPAARRRVLECIDANCQSGGAPSLSDLAEAACLSEFHFARMFKQSFGMAPHAWLMQRRLANARTLLARGQLALSDVAQQAGYAHPSHLNADLRRAGLGSAGRYRDALAAAL